MDESLDKYGRVSRLVEFLQDEIKVCLDRLLIHKIILSSHNQEECNLLSKEISGVELAHLLASRHVAKEIGYFGIRIMGLTILGKFDLDSVKIEFPLVFKNCIFKDSIILRDANTRFLSFEGSKCQYINASRIIVDGSLWFNRGFSAKKGIELNNSQVIGNIDLSGATIEPIQEESYFRGKSLVLECATVGGHLWLRSYNSKRFKSRGEINLSGAIIKGSFICHGAQLKSDGRFIDQENGKPLALKAKSAIVTGAIEFNKGFESQGQMLLMNMEIHGDVKCEGGKFSHSALSNGCHQANDSHKHAISFDRSVINGSVFLCDGFEACGQVRLIGTVIKNDLDCSAGKFLLSRHARDYYAIFVLRGNIQGDVSFRGTQPGRGKPEPFSTDGLVYLNSVKINGNLDLTHGVMFNKNNLNLGIDQNNLEKGGILIHNCVVGLWIKFRNIKLNNETVISLSGTNAGGLDHNWNTFLAKDCIKKINMDRFIYDRYECHDDNGLIDQSLDWVNILDKRHGTSSDKNKLGFSNSSANCFLGSYQQLATVLIKNGKIKDAENILIEMEYKSGRFGKIFSAILKYGVGFGYRPRRALIYTLVLIIVGAFVFNYGYEKKVFYPNDVEPTKRLDCINDQKKCPFGHQPFRPFIYSIEAWIPVIPIDFGVKKKWEINDSTEMSNSYLILVYSWVHKSLGWLFSTLVFGGFTALLIRKR